MTASRAHPRLLRDGDVMWGSPRHSQGASPSLWRVGRSPADSPSRCHTDCSGAYASHLAALLTGRGNRGTMSAGLPSVSLQCRLTVQIRAHWLPSTPACSVQRSLTSLRSLPRCDQGQSGSRCGASTTTSRRHGLPARYQSSSTSIWLSPTSTRGRLWSLGAGATKAAVQSSPERWRVLIDPAGHPFCLSTLTPD